MHIVFDARTVRKGMTGVGRYAAAIAGRLPRQCPQDFFTFLCLNGQEPAWGEQGLSENTPNMRRIAVNADYESHPGGDWWEQRVLPRLLEKWEAEVFHGPAYRIPSMLPHCRAARIVTLHDLSVYTLPGAYSWGFRTYMRWMIARSLASADRVICVSYFVRDEALRIFPKLPATKFAVVHQAAGDPFAPATEARQNELRRLYGLPDAYLLTAGTFETRKNPGFIAELYSGWDKCGKRSPPRLIWAGHLGHGSSRWLADLAPLREKHLFELRQCVTDGEMLALYQCANAFVYPSSHEGFGMPLLEAMACGVPVVAADNTALREVVGPGGACLPLGAPEQWVETLETVLEPGFAREEAIARALRQGRARSWDDTARETRSIYGTAV